MQLKKLIHQGVHLALVVAVLLVSADLLVLHLALVVVAVLLVSAGLVFSLALVADGMKP